MTIDAERLRGLILLGGLVTAPAVVSCTDMSVRIPDEAAGSNGGFEIDHEGLPVNWLVYAPETVPDADFDVRLDRSDFREGEQSLRFDVRECSASGGWHSPGISQEFPAQPGGTYRVSFWLKAEDSAHRARVGAVDAFTGGYETIRASERSTDGWELVEREFTVPAKYDRIRFELNVLSAGRLWVDDVRIEPTDQGG